MSHYGRKRIRPMLDTSVEDEDDVQTEKFARMRSRARVPTKKTTGRNSQGNSSSSSANVSGNDSNAFSVSIAANSSQEGSSTSYGNHSKRPGSTFEDKLRKTKPKPFFLIGRDSDERKPYQKPPIRDKGKSNPRKLYKKRHSGGTPVSNRRGPSHVETPEFMKVKEDESILEEKRDRKRRRNKIMSLRTAKGQPVMRGRIALMLEEIKASTQQN